MKVITLKTTKAANTFLANENVKQAFIQRELAPEPYRFREEVLRTKEFEEWK